MPETSPKLFPGNQAALHLQFFHSYTKPNPPWTLYSSYGQGVGILQPDYYQAMGGILKAPNPCNTLEADPKPQAQISNQEISSGFQNPHRSVMYLGALFMYNFPCFATAATEFHFVAPRAEVHFLTGSSPRPRLLALAHPHPQLLQPPARQRPQNAWLG